MKFKITARMIIQTTIMTWLGTWVLLSPSIAAPLYYKLLFYPDYPARYEEKSYALTSLQGVAKQVLSIPSTNGAKVSAWFFRHPHSKRVVVVSHGNAGNLADRAGVADDFLQMGTSVLLYDYQGYGLSEGEPSVPNICADGEAVFKYLQNQLGYRDKDIILYGESLGCAVSCDVSTRHQCAALILQSGFSSLKEISQEKFGIFHLYPDAMFPPPRLNNLAILKGEHPPLLLIHGQNDRTIPVKHSIRMFEQASEPKTLVTLPNSGHCVEQNDHDLYMSSVRTFLSESGLVKQPENRKDILKSRKAPSLS